ncbi:hypothetical protein [Wolbachia endosymbiont of Drosophila tsacasi]|uniref:hypothetical protein n=1 Tax=Wolbachia endosymbiont of Drosophila tsacasi TaxID=3002579 RepID=UPI0023A94B95|nr:hypothetical protein [Wolbachia endosymbiont of Drosophila tsacasi]MDE5062513.1 hypothetical protein [Wolbachia endosymbiont of Drosophila tsacasi]
MYDDYFYYNATTRGGCITECGISLYNTVPLEHSILIDPCFYFKHVVFDDDNIRNRLAEDLTKDKTKLDIFVNGILAIRNSDLVLSYINKIGGLNEEARDSVNRLQKSNMLDKILNKDDTTLTKLALRELLKSSVLQETKLESPQVSRVGNWQYCSIGS